ncbi:MAG: hypothetical protein C0498_01230 [Anaerolinea sp.]|nr:hypothetical protein [Anaerolinea sp.]
MTLLTVADAARRLGMSPKFVRARCASGDLAHYRLGRAVRVSDRDLDEFLARSRLSGDARSPRGQHLRADHPAQDADDEVLGRRCVHALRSAHRLRRDREGGEGEAGRAASGARRRARPAGQLQPWQLPREVAR